MATIRYKCRCGVVYAIYMRMSKMLKQLPDVPKKCIKEKEKLEDDAEGDTKYANWRAKLDGMTFIEGHTLDVFKCQCGTAIDLCSFIRKHRDEIWRNEIIKEDKQLT